MHLTERFTLKIEVLLSSLKGFSAEKDLWTDGTQSFKSHLNFQAHSRCLKITEKVSFNIASEASYIYIKKAKNDPIWRVFENLKLAVKQCYQTILNSTKNDRKCHFFAP